jgi:DNA-binding PadR family transcriptional regulator
MKFLSRIEEIILLAIWKLQDNAYGMSIREQVAKDTNVNWLTGAIYAPLGRLLKNGYISSTKGEATAERGGRHKIYYRLTLKGKKKLLAIQEVNNAIWSEVPKLTLE